MITEHCVYSYCYDARYRLISAVNPTLADETYTYDETGNRLSAADIAGTGNYNDANQLKDYGEVTQLFDLNGSPTSRTVAGVTKTYVHDLDNRLIEVKDSASATLATYYYDLFGRRLWKDVAGTRTYFQYSSEGLLAEMDAVGTVTQSYGYEPQSTYGTTPLYTHTVSGYAYYQLDHLGTSQQLVDKTGKVQWRGRAQAFGETTLDVELVRNNFRFAGQYYDGETGLHYNLNRYYSPEIGRYITSDPIGLDGGLNTYAYVGGNPVKYIDPDDLCRRGYVPMDGNPNVCVPTNFVKLDRCVTAECAADLNPVPDYTDEQNYKAGCNTLVGMICGPVAVASSETGPGTVAAYAACRPVVYGACNSACEEPEGCIY